jgi:uncharacterized protein (DUF1501 family)
MEHAMSAHRRDFLKSSSLLACGLTVPGFLGRTALAAPTADKQGAKDTILVVVQLTGGNDGLNTVIPFADPDYAKHRPTLRVPVDQVKKIDDHIGLHPQLTGFAELLQDRALCIVQGVGYPNPSQSHFRSMDIWQAASTAETLAEGWLGKALKAAPSPAPAFHLAYANETAPLALEGAPARVPSLTSLADFQLKTAAATGQDAQEQKKVIEGSARPLTPDPAPPKGEGNLLDFVQRTAVQTYASRRSPKTISRRRRIRIPPWPIA